MMDANIDLIYIHLIHTFDAERTNLYQALYELRMEGYQVPQVAPWLNPNIVFHPLFLGPIDLCIPADLDLFMEQYVDFYEAYWQVDPAGTPFLATIDGKPVLSTWARGTRVSGPECLPRSVFESKLEDSLGSYFQNGVYFASIAQPHGFDWADEYNRSFVGYTGGSFLIDGHVAVLKPGFWDLLDRYFARDGGSSYVNGWNQLLSNTMLRQIQIESWNEYTEGTGIFEADPTMAYWLPA